MNPELKLILVIAAVILAAFAIAYLYFSANIFVNLLKRPIKLISWGMLCLDVGVLLVTLFSYEAIIGNEIRIFGYSLAVFFYVFYVAGSVLVVLGARQFKRRPQP